MSLPKRVLVTGGGTGIGYAIAEELVQRGSEVIICGRRRRVIERAAAQIGATPLSGDITGPPEPLLQAVQSAGLMEPTMVAGEERFGEADLQMARTSLSILATGFPLDELLRPLDRAHRMRAVHEQKKPGVGKATLFLPR